MIRIFKNLSGQKWCRDNAEISFYLALYFPYFGISFNFHPNRLKQFYREKILKQK